MGELVSTTASKQHHGWTCFVSQMLLMAMLMTGTQRFFALFQTVCWGRMRLLQIRVSQWSHPCSSCAFQWHSEGRSTTLLAAGRFFVFVRHRYVRKLSQARRSKRARERRASRNQESARKLRDGREEPATEDAASGPRGKAESRDVWRETEDKTAREAVSQKASGRFDEKRAKWT